MRRMMAARHGAILRAGRLLLGLACVAGFAGCDFRPSAPESRAEYFVEKLVREPQALDDLRAVAQLAEGEGPEALVRDIPTRTAVTYLRARLRLGADLGFHVAGLARDAPDRKLVNVSVSEGLAVGAADSVRFQVEMVRAGADWRVARLHAD